MELGGRKSDESSNVEVVVGDIEENKITNCDPNAKSRADDDEHGDDMDVDMDREAAAPGPGPIRRLGGALKKPAMIAGMIVCGPVIVVVSMICSLWVGSEIFNGSGKAKEGSGIKIAEEKEEEGGGLYAKVQAHNTSMIKGRTRSVMVTCRLGCLLLIWLLLSTTLPPLRHALSTATLLGVIHWKWSLLAAFLVLSYPFIFISLVIYGFMFHQYLLHAGPGLYYYAFYIGNGLFESVVSILHLASFFLLWMLYFHGRAPLDTGVDDYVTRTLATLLAASLLWLLKTALLLRWEQRSVFEKFRARILMSAFRLSVLCRLFHGSASVSLLPSRYQQTNYEWEVRDYLDSPFSLNKNARDYIVSSAYVSLHQMQDAAEYLTVLAQTATSRSMDDAHQLSDLIHAYQQTIANSFSNPNEATTEAIIRHLTKSISNQTLYTDVLQAEYASKDINQIRFDKWVVDAHKSCLSVAYTLTDAFAMVSVLNMILTSCLIIMVIVIWLLVTELATTTVLVVIASPFLALSFVFGDVCKTFFQGFIFSFITHPLNIGDRCVINGIEVEVKRVNIMTTTCLKIGTNEQMLYPNSNLATMLIINLGDKLDPNDEIELILPPSTKLSDILEMKKQIENFIDLDEQHVLFEKERDVVVKEIKNGIKILVFFQHAMDGNDVSYSQFFEKKVRQRSMLFIEIKKILENLGLEVAT